MKEVEGFRDLVTKLCRDDDVTQEVKAEMLKEWKSSVVDAGRGIVMDKKLAEKHFGMLEIIDNAIRIVG